MKIWVDADACPRVVKDLLFRVAKRTGVSVTLVANQYLFIPREKNIDFIQVESGLDKADQKIVELCAEGDMVITADIPLAAAVVKKNAFALNPRGTLYDSANINDILSVRDLMENLRSGFIDERIGGPDIFTAKDCENFANALDKFMSRKR